MKFKAVLFDMDGVLIKSMPFHIRSWQKALHLADIPATKEELALLEGAPFKRTITLLSKKYKIPLTSHQHEAIYAMKKQLLAKEFVLFPYRGIFTLLRLLRSQGTRLALVTGSNKEFVHDIISHKFGGFFEVIVTGSDMKRGKPFPDPYVAALEQLNVAARSCLVIENAPLGIQSARAAKLRTYALATTLDASYLQEANRIFSNHKELLHYMRRG